MNTFNHIYVKKVKLNPSKSQMETFDFWLRKCKYLYNVALEEKLIYYKSTKKYLNVYDQKKELPEIKEFDNSFKDVPNKSLQEIIFRVDNSFKSFFKSGGFPKFKRDLNSIEFIKTDLRLKEGKFYLPKIKEPIKTTEDIKSGWTSGRLTKSGNNYFIILIYSKYIEVVKENDDVLGIDLGLMSLYTDSNGNKAKRFSKKLISKYYQRILELNQSLSKKIKGSRKFKKVKKHLNKTYNRLKDSKNDYLHKESLKLVRGSKEGVIALGDIKIQNIVNNKKSKRGIVKSFYQNSLGIFKQYVVYKSVKFNKEIKLVDERMTSKTCSCCGQVNLNLKLGDRIYNCLNCLNSIDRDQNSAINMKWLGSSNLSLKDKFVLA